jgi:hypothetical protein
MSQKTFLGVTGVIFLFVAIVHLLRLIFKWEVVLAGWPAPVWLSGVAFVIAAALAYEGLRLSRKN